ncbi:MAG: transporter substrate-binding domain-containing protein [Paucibacter sp.]|nr:transporter substrate-binding domain-containing protein [Roseateles sp.]
MKLLFALPLALVACTTLAAEPLLIAYRDKPPYSTEDNGQAIGILIDKSRAIFREAGLEVRYLVMPQKRVVAELEANKRPLCSPGWYHLPAREAIGSFSLAIHQDKPQIVLASAKAAPAARAHASVKALLQDRQLRLAVVDGVSYGAELDAMIKAMPEPPMHVPVSPLQLGRMIAAHRADYMLMDQDDFEYLDRSQELSGSGIQTLHFADMPPGLARHFWCSKAVMPAVLRRINDAIHKLGYDAP